MKTKNMSKNIPAYIKIYLALFAFIFVSGYIVFNSRILIEGPKLNVETPENGQKTEEEVVEITGSTENVVFISINDRPITIDESGYFNEKILLNSGYNTINIEAKDKFDRMVNKTLKLLSDNDNVASVAFLMPEKKSGTSTDNASDLETGVDETGTEINEETEIEENLE